MTMASDRRPAPKRKQLIDLADNLSCALDMTRLCGMAAESLDKDTSEPMQRGLLIIEDNLLAIKSDLNRLIDACEDGQ